MAESQWSIALTGRRVALLLLLCALPLAGCGRDDLILDQTQTALPADGRVHPLLTLRHRSGDALPASALDQQTPPSNQAPRMSLEQVDSGLVRGFLRSPVNPGDARITLAWRGHAIPISVQFVLDDRDGYGDGTPDFLRLHSDADRRAFRAWFTGIAEEELTAPRLPAEIDDCAALLRFSYREALVKHDAQWLAGQSFPARLLSLPSVTQYYYPRTPLGAALFRIKPGPFIAADLTNGSFAQFADARSLIKWNTYFVSRDPNAAIPGDLLFFRQLEQNSPYHSMIVTGENADVLIYHTGPIGKAKGEMRQVAREDLLRYPDARWRPVPGNSNFLGVYRWNILREGD